MNLYSVLIISVLCTWGMVGVIWTIQLVHYPMLAVLSALQPATAAQDHARRITWVVGPLMAGEGFTALLLVFRRPPEIGFGTSFVAAAFLGVALLTTVVEQVPLHTALSAGHDDRSAQRLVRTNWVRTAAWTARGLVLAAALLVD
jgi:hypothetical protein